ncbi:sensor histidine kinase N-terminal domain-containing protein [Azonexus sp.]|uniref:sensor histidine kinase n=1 Tax=Azonexus sp. TaxID=1872668 RepID=UPI0039E4EE6A
MNDRKASETPPGAVSAAAEGAPQVSGAPESERSLFGEILDWMLAPLLFVWPLSIAFTHYFANSVANYPYDQALREQVTALSRQVDWPGAKQGLRLPNSAQAMLRSDELDNVYFLIQASPAAHAKAKLLGDTDLPSLSAQQIEHLPLGEIQLRDEEYKGQDIRIAYAAYRQTAGGPSLLIQVAETTEKRTQLANRIVASVILPQFVIIPLAVMLVWFGLSRGLRPLHRLRQTIEKRDPADLSPIATRRVPEELDPLVDAFNAMLERMQNNVAVQQRFVADAAHQLRTPLTGLKTQAQLASRENDPAALRHALRQIATGVDRAGRLVNQLLTLARTEAQDNSLPHAPLDLAVLARTVVEDWVMRALQRNIDLGYEAPGAAMVMGNAFLLQELLKNLLDNALHYTPDGGQVTCRVLATEHSVFLEVEDNGIGISPEQAERVFERFYRVDDAAGEGSGLGLPIVQEIASQHQGRARLMPRARERGTLAHVVLPLWQPPLPPPPPPEDYAELYRQSPPVGS